MNGLRITGVFDNDVELQSTSTNGRSETVAWMAANTENEIELTITEDRTGEFRHAWNMGGDVCPSFTSKGDTAQPLQPSDFNHFECCDFSFAAQGYNINRLFENDGNCNDTNFTNGITGDYPYEESPVTLCYTRGAGDYDTVINPVCDVW